MVIRALRIPEPGETLLGGDFFTNPGGKGANQAVAAARMGADVTLIAKTGNDLFGRELIEVYRKEHIRTDFVFTDPRRPTGVAMITVDANGENSIIVAPGANHALLTTDIDKALPAIRDCQLVLLQLEIPVETVTHIACLAAERGKPVVLNPAPACDLPAELLGATNFLVPNRAEAEFLSGIRVTDKRSALIAAEIMQRMGPRTVIITLGADGVVVRDREETYHVEAFPVVAVDTTAAGDAFCGVLCVGMAEGQPLRDAIKMAARAAAISVTRRGAQSSVPFRNEL
jgi:ribokinase